MMLQAMIRIFIPPVNSLFPLLSNLLFIHNRVPLIKQ